MSSICSHHKVFKLVELSVAVAEDTCQVMMLATTFLSCNAVQSCYNIIAIAHSRNSISIARYFHKPSSTISIAFCLLYVANIHLYNGIWDLCSECVILHYWRYFNHQFYRTTYIVSCTQLSSVIIVHSLIFISMSLCLALWQELNCYLSRNTTPAFYSRAVVHIGTITTILCFVAFCFVVICYISFCCIIIYISRSADCYMRTCLGQFLNCNCTAIYGYYYIHWYTLSSLISIWIHISNTTL